MENNINPDEKRKVLQEFNHRLNNDLQALMAFIKLQKRFGIDNEEIINFSYVSIASISSIQNLMYKTNDENNLIGTGEFFREFIKVLEDYYIKSNAIFSVEIENDFHLNPKKMFHLMLLCNEMVNLSLNHPKEIPEKKISFNLENIGEECLLIYCDNGLGINEKISKTDVKKVIFEQLIKQLDGTLDESSKDSIVSLKFSTD